MDIGFNKDTAAWVGASLSVLLASIQLLKWIYNRYFKKRLAVSTDYDYELDRIKGIIVTSLHEKPFIINGYNIYKVNNKNENSYYDNGNFVDFIYKRLNHYDLYRINIDEDIVISLKKEKKIFIEIFILGSDKPKILEIK